MTSRTITCKEALDPGTACTSPLALSYFPARGCEDMPPSPCIGDKPPISGLLPSGGSLATFLSDGNSVIPTVPSSSYLLAGWSDNALLILADVSTADPWFLQPETETNITCRDIVSAMVWAGWFGFSPLRPAR